MSVFRSWTLANLGIRHLVCITALVVFYWAIGSFRSEINLSELFTFSNNVDTVLLLAFSLLVVPFWGFIVDNNKTEGWAGFGGFSLIVFGTLYLIGNLESTTGWGEPAIRIAVISFAFGIVVGILDGIYTFRNIDDVISRRMRWRESPTGILNFRLIYSIDRLFASASCTTIWSACAIIFHYIKIKSSI